MTVIVADAGNMERRGYTFIGWNTVANGSGTSRPVGSTFKIGTEDVILYAQWSLDHTYTVTYFVMVILEVVLLLMQLATRIMQH